MPTTDYDTCDVGADYVTEGGAPLEYLYSGVAMARHTAERIATHLSFDFPEYEFTVVHYLRETWAVYSTLPSTDARYRDIRVAAKFITLWIEEMGDP